MAPEKRLIDANALLEKVQFRMDIDNKNAEIIAGCVDITRRLIENAPTVDAAEVEHGEWSTIEDDNTGMIALKCSECNEECWFEDEPPMKIYKYCPNCGAKMDGGIGNG